jgi:hypothetical protein
MSTKEAIERLDAAVCALEDVDVSKWSETTMIENLEDLSAALCRVDAQLARLADAVRARGFRVQEPVAAG